MIGSISEGGVGQFPRGRSAVASRTSPQAFRPPTRSCRPPPGRRSTSCSSPTVPPTWGAVLRRCPRRGGADATIYPFAVGASASCSAGTDGTLDEMATASGTSCFSVPDPADLPDVIKNVTATSLTGLAVEVDSGAATETVVPALPQAGPTSVAWTAPLEDLAPGSHEVCATATGVGPASDATAEESVDVRDVLRLRFRPHAADRDQRAGLRRHAPVTATVSGPAGEAGGGRSTSPSTPARMPVSRGRAPRRVPDERLGSGDVHLHRSNGTGLPRHRHHLRDAGRQRRHGGARGGEAVEDTTLPVAECTPSTNPLGHTPAAPGKGGPGPEPGRLLPPPRLG